MIELGEIDHPPVHRVALRVAQALRVRPGEPIDRHGAPAQSRRARRRHRAPPGDREDAVGRLARRVRRVHDDDAVELHVLGEPEASWIDPALCVVVIRPRRGRLELERRRAVHRDGDRVRLPLHLAEAVDGERPVQPISNGRADLGALRDANDGAGCGERLARLPERGHVEATAAVTIGPPHAGSRLDRDRQDPVLESTAGSAVVVGEDAIGRRRRRRRGREGPESDQRGVCDPLRH